MIYTSFQCLHSCMTPHAYMITGRIKLAYSHRNSWTKVHITYGQYHLRSHSCHAIGSQLLIVGGYPPGFYVDPSVSCSTELIQIFDMNEISVRQSPIPALYFLE